jgi:hypothetical protein
MPSSGMCFHVGLIRDKILQECVTSSFKAEGIGELGTMLAVTSNIGSNKTYVPEVGILHSHHCGNLKSYKYDPV